MAMKSTSGGSSWPFGVLPALVITTGNTVSLSPGDVKDYASVQVDLGGTLEVTGPGTAPVIIGCLGNFINNGIVRYKQADAGGVSASPSVTAPDGTVVAYTIATPVGGAGGSGGSQGFGNGGGGVGGFGNNDFGDPGDPGAAGTATQGGKGGGGGTGDFPFPTHSTGGIGGLVFGNNGGIDPGLLTGFSGGGGGGGGSRGYSGGGLYIRCKGTISGTGVFDVSGNNGGNGGSYSPGDFAVDNSSGAGGGAAGGSGGKIIVRYSINSFAGTYVVTGGAGGSGGSGGTYGFPGGAGTSGPAGSTDIAAF